MHDWIGHAFRLVGVAVASIWQYGLLKRGAAAQRRAKVRVKQLEAALAIISRVTSLYAAAQSTLSGHKTLSAKVQAELRIRTTDLYTETSTINRTFAQNLPPELHAAVAHFLTVYHQLLTADPLAPVGTISQALEHAYQLVGEQMRLRLGIDQLDEDNR